MENKNCLLCVYLVTTYTTNIHYEYTFETRIFWFVTPSRGWALPQARVDPFLPAVVSPPPAAGPPDRPPDLNSRSADGRPRADRWAGGRFAHPYMC